MPAAIADSSALGPSVMPGAPIQPHSPSKFKRLRFVAPPSRSVAY